MEPLILKDVVCEIYDANIHIRDSYKIKSKSKMIEILYAIKHKYPDCKTFLRNEKSLLSEWRAHNRLYCIGYKRNHTKDVDLEYPVNKKYEILYRIIGI